MLLFFMKCDCKRKVDYARYKEYKKEDIFYIHLNLKRNMDYGNSENIIFKYD